MSSTPQSTPSSQIQQLNKAIRTLNSFSVSKDKQIISGTFQGRTWSISYIDTDDADAIGFAGEMIEGTFKRSVEEIFDCKARIYDLCLQLKDKSTTVDAIAPKVESYANTAREAFKQLIEYNNQLDETRKSPLQVSEVMTSDHCSAKA